MIDSFVENVSLAETFLQHSVPQYNWGESQDIEHKSVITGKRSFIKMGDYAEITYTVYIYKLGTATEDTTTATDIYSLRGKEGTLKTGLGWTQVRCTQIKKDYLDPISGSKAIAILTFKSLGYV